jgi:hypothetical protein
MVETSEQAALRFAEQHPPKKVLNINHLIDKVVVITTPEGVPQMQEQLVKAIINALKEDGL